MCDQSIKQDGNTDLEWEELVLVVGETQRPHPVLTPSEQLALTCRQNQGNL